MAAKKSAHGAKASKAKSAPKRTAVKKSALRGVAPCKADISIAGKSAAARAAEVEHNIGGSRPLADFLDEINWYQ
jgi:hypothetical protein